MGGPWISRGVMVVFVFGTPDSESKIWDLGVEPSRVM